MEKQQRGRDHLLEHLDGQIKAQRHQLDGFNARRAEQAAQLKAAEVLFTVNVHFTDHKGAATLMSRNNLAARRLTESYTV